MTSAGRGSVIAQTVNIHEAKAHLSRLVDEVYSGEEIIIAKAGKPLAKLVALTAAGKKRKLGILKGKLRAPEDFDDQKPRVLTRF